MARRLSHSHAGRSDPRAAAPDEDCGVNGMSAESSRRDFLKRAGMLTLAVPGAAAVLDACSSVATQAKASTIRVGWAIEPDTMNPLTTYSTEAVEVLQLVYDNLIHYGLELKPEPGLATSWTYSGDGKIDHLPAAQGDLARRQAVHLRRRQVHLRADQVQAGQPVRPVGHRPDLAPMRPTTATLVLHFSRPQAFNPGLAVPILPQHIWQSMSASGHPEVRQRRARSARGPYKFVNWKQGPVHRDRPQRALVGHASRRRRRSAGSCSRTRMSWRRALRTGAVDICPEIPPTIWDGLPGRRTSRRSRCSRSPSTTSGSTSRTTRSPAATRCSRTGSIRQALSYAVDRQQLVNVALAGHGLPAAPSCPTGFGEWHLDIPADSSTTRTRPRPRRCWTRPVTRSAAAAGVRTSTDGKPLSFRLIAIQSTSVDVAAAQLFRDACAKVGIQLNLTTLDANSLGTTVYNSKAPNWDIFVWGWDSGVYDPDYMLGVPLCNQIGSNNDVYYCSRHYDQLYDEQATELDHAARARAGPPGPAVLLRRRCLHHHVVPGQAAGLPDRHLERLDRGATAGSSSTSPGTTT